MSKLRQRKLLSKFMFAILGLVVFLFAYQLGNRYAQPENLGVSAFLFTQPVALAAFSLIDHDGTAFGLQNLAGYWTLLVLGDHRHESCKQFMVRYVMAWNRLAHNKQLQEITRAAFLTLVPTNTRDKDLKSFIEFIHPDFVGLTGEVDEIQQFVTGLGLTGSDYIPDRCTDLDSTVALINPQGQLSALFTGISDPAIIAHDLEAIVKPE